MDALLAPAHTPDSETKIVIGNLSVNLPNKIVMVGQERRYMEAREFQVLAALLLSYQKDTLEVVSKQTLYDMLYADEEKKPDINVVRVFICNLRKKLDNSKHNSRIETVGYKGYRMRRPPDPLPVSSE